MLAESDLIYIYMVVLLHWVYFNFNTFIYKKIDLQQTYHTSLMLFEAKSFKNQNLISLTKYQLPFFSSMHFSPNNIY